MYRLLPGSKRPSRVQLPGDIGVDGRVGISRPFDRLHELPAPQEQQIFVGSLVNPDVQRSAGLIAIKLGACVECASLSELAMPRTASFFNFSTTGSSAA